MSPWVWVAAGIVLVVVVFEQSPRLGGWLLLALVIGFLLMNRQLLEGLR